MRASPEYLYVGCIHLDPADLVSDPLHIHRDYSQEWDTSKLE